MIRSRVCSLVKGHCYCSGKWGERVYQALYRKWRPQTFDEVVGQQHITETLKSQVRNDRLSHAYLFIGTRGTGKTTCARILARAVNCEHPVNGNPCGHCASCRGILDGSILDVVELDAASNNGVDNVRALRDEAVFSPSVVKKRVYIIDEVHMLSMPAFNALLKILEEPPAHLMFILATTELQKVPATILSRCQRHNFRRLESETIARYLLQIAEREQLELEDEAASLIARLADGGVRDALSLLDQCSVHGHIDQEAVYSTVGLAGKRRIAELLDAVLRHKTEKALTLFSELWMEGKDPASVLEELSTLLRDILMLCVAPKAGLDLISGGYEQRTLEHFAKRSTPEELTAALETVQKALVGLREVKNPRTAAEICLVSLSTDAGGDSFARLRARIARLEEQLERGLPIAPVQTERAERPVPENAADPAEEEPPLPEEPPLEEEPPLAEDELHEYAPPAPQAPAEAPDEPTEPQAPDAAGDLWPQIRKAALPMLPIDSRISLEDESRVQGRVEGNFLILESPLSFLVDRFQKQDVLQRLSEAARSVSGRELRVQVRLRQEEQRQVRSLDDLRKFKEVHFSE